jgi:hypothetical protein
MRAVHPMLNVQREGFIDAGNATSSVATGAFSSFAFLLCSFSLEQDFQL